MLLKKEKKRLAAEARKSTRIRFVGETSIDPAQRLRMNLKTVESATLIC
jgi:hypothetical protein